MPCRTFLPKEDATVNPDMLVGIFSAVFGIAYAVMSWNLPNASIGNPMTISFHHHLRNGDAVMPMVLAELQKMGFKNMPVVPEEEWMRMILSCGTAHISIG